MERLDGVLVHRVWSWRKSIHDSGIRGAVTFLLAAIFRLRKILNSGEVDVVHYFFGLPTGLLSIYSRGVRGIPYIVSLRGSDVPLYDQDSRKLVYLHLLLRSVTHRIWRNAAQVVAVSEGLRKLAEASFDDIPVAVIHNGTEIIEDALQRRGISEAGPLRIICVARLIPRKGIGELLDAVTILLPIDFELVLVGTGPDMPRLRKIAESRGIGDRVRFVGYCPQEVVWEHYVKADIFVLPTMSDAFPNVVLEAMSAALPVVASDVGGVGEAVIDGETGFLVEAGDSEAIAAAVRKLAEDAKLRRAFGIAGQRRARQLFSWERNTKQHVDAYRLAIEPRPGDL